MLCYKGLFSSVPKAQYSSVMILCALFFQQLLCFQYDIKTKSESSSIPSL